MTRATELVGALSVIVSGAVSTRGIGIIVSAADVPSSGLGTTRFCAIACSGASVTFCFALDVFSAGVIFDCFGAGIFFTHLAVEVSGSFGPLYLNVIFFTPATTLSTLGASAWPAWACDWADTVEDEPEIRRPLERSCTGPLILRDLRTATTGS